MAIAGDYIDGAFVCAEGEGLVSRNPSKGSEVVVETTWSASQVDRAVDAAHAAQPAWSRRSFDERWAALVRFRSAIESRKEALADAIVCEIGKIRTEARTEIQTLLGRFDVTANVVRSDLRDGPLPGFPNESLRWHPHGVVGVIGPFNFPLHLCHAHVVPALLLGNTVVVKPSELAPLCGVRYAEAAHAAGLPPGVLNVVQGRGATGAAMVAHPRVHGLAFTGSWPVGRRIAEAALDRPEMLVALEMGGKNTAIVCEDADVRQAAHEIVVGGYLTTGQRCTCTDRVLVHRAKKKALIDALRPLVAGLVFGDPDDPRAFAGPLASEAGREKLERAMAAAERAGADAVVEGARLEGGVYRSGSFHVLPDGVHEIPGYTDVELFGPELGIETFDDDAHAIALINGSPYGFANSIFTSDDVRFDRYYRDTRVGILNRNRSTNQASPRLPFGGTGRSGNFRPAGSFAARNLALPVAVQSNVAGAFPVLPALRASLVTPDLDDLEARHAREELTEAARRLVEPPRPIAMRRPAGGALPVSTTLLERFHANDRTSREQSPPVFDHLRSYGPWLVSVDDAPLSVLDATSQSGALPLGFMHESMVRAYADGTFGDAMLRAHDLCDPEGEGAHIAAQYAAALRALVPGFDTVCFTASGAEAIERACALARAHTDALGWNATRLMAFEGSSHGRAWPSLHTGDAVDFAPFPRWDGQAAGEPAEPDGFRDLCARGAASELASRFGGSSDPLLAAEVASLAEVARHGAARTHFAVVIEPMQGEGGDRYATARFHRALRLVTRAIGIPLIVDESHCGFGLGGSFAWHASFGYVDRAGAPDRPDAVVFAQRAQVGVVMSTLADVEPTQAYAASLVRGRLYASAIAESDDARRVEALVRPRLRALEVSWGHRIAHPRVRGLALAFDLASAAERESYLGQRFWRGAISLGTGDRTVSHRLNAAFGEREIDQLFTSIRQSLAWLEAHPGKKPPAWEDLDVPHAKSDPAIGVRVASASEASAPLPSPPPSVSSGLVTPFVNAPASLALAERGGLLAGPTIQKIALSTYVTPSVVRATEWAAAVAPDHPHLVLVSGRDETIDKTARMLRHHRKTGRVVLGLEGGYVGHTTAWARSISDPRVHRGGPTHFDFPRVPHPAEVGDVASIEAMRAQIRAISAGAVLGVVVEMVQERTGRVLSESYLLALDALRRETGVPIVLVETASAYYRSGRGPFASSAHRVRFVPDALVWWSGGQLGFVHVTGALWVATPHALGPSIDGDELSLVQAHHQLRAARHVDVGSASAALDGALAPLASVGIACDGLGLYRVVRAGDRAAALVSALGAQGARVHAFPHGAIPIAPPLDRAQHDASAIARGIVAFVGG